LSDLYLFAKVYTNLSKDNVLQLAVKIVLVVLFEDILIKWLMCMRSYSSHV